MARGDFCYNLLGDYEGITNLLGLSCLCALYFGFCFCLWNTMMCTKFLHTYLVVTVILVSITFKRVLLSRGNSEKTQDAGWDPTYRHFHGLHGEVTWWLQGLGPGGVPEGSERGKSSEAHKCVGRKGAHVLPNVHQLWQPKILQ